MNLGPVLDLYNGLGNGIGDRAFSESPETVAAYGQAFAQGMLEGGIFPVLKHWPGGGSADGDPHNKGTITKGLDALRTADAVVTGNRRQAFDQLDPGHRHAVDADGQTTRELDFDHRRGVRRGGESTGQLER